MALQLELDVFHDGPFTKVVIMGELDACTAPELHSVLASLAASGVPAVVLDLTALDFADSSGLEPVVQLREEFHDLVLYGPSRPIRHLLDVLGLAFSTTPGVVEKSAVA